MISLEKGEGEKTSPTQRGKKKHSLLFLRREEKASVCDAPSKARKRKKKKKKNRSTEKGIKRKKKGARLSLLRSEEILARRCDTQREGGREIVSPNLLGRGGKRETPFSIKKNAEKKTAIFFWGEEKRKKKTGDSFTRGGGGDRRLLTRGRKPTERLFCSGGGKGTADQSQDAQKNQKMVARKKGLFISQVVKKWQPYLKN